MARDRLRPTSELAPIPDSRHSCRRTRRRLRGRLRARPSSRPHRRLAPPPPRPVELRLASASRLASGHGRRRPGRARGEHEHHEHERHPQGRRRCGHEHLHRSASGSAADVAYSRAGVVGAPSAVAPLHLAPQQQYVRGGRRVPVGCSPGQRTYRTCAWPCEHAHGPFDPIVGSISVVAREWPVEVGVRPPRHTRGLACRRGAGRRLRDKRLET